MTNLILSIHFILSSFLLLDNRTKKITLIHEEKILQYKDWLFNIFLTILLNWFSWHIPVLYKELIYGLGISNIRQNIVVDATLWLGWHAKWVIENLCENDIFIWFDADLDNLENAKNNIINHFWDKIKNKNIQLFFIYSNFRNITEKLSEIWIEKITAIYYDFWVNSVHYDNWDKWFSFRFDWPLDLRFDRNNWITASDVINNYSESDLRRVFYNYWEEKKTPFIIKSILQKREIKKITTTFELLDIIEKASFDPKSKTRVFQALRIEVNDEFWAIKESLNKAIPLLKEEWIMACITFHSLEDRITKQIFWEFCKDEIDDFSWQISKKWIAKKITKKPIIPTNQEIENNPRSRSAKLRIIQKN